MAFALRFDGVNDSAQTVTIVKASEWELHGEFIYKELGFVGFFGGGRGFGIESNNSRFTFYAPAQQVFYSIGSSVAVDDDIKFKLIWTDNGNGTYELNCQLNINDAGFTGNLSVAIGSKTFSALLPDTRLDLGRRPYTIYTAVDWLNVQYIESGITLNNWDADSSSRGVGTPVLTDIIGGDDATGINMPTDGSAWIDLGGSGVSVSPDPIDQAQTMGEISLTEHSSITLNSIDQAQTMGEVSLTENSVISLNSMTQAQTMGELSLTEAGTLLLSSMSQAQTMSEVSLTEHSSITLNSIDQAQTMSEVSLTEAGVLLLNSMDQSQFVDEIQLTEHSIVSLDSFLQSQSLDIMTVSEVGGTLLTLFNSSQSQTVTGTQLTEHSLITLDNMTQEQLLGSINFGIVVGYLEGELSIVYAYNGKTTIINVLTGKTSIL